MAKFLSYFPFGSSKATPTDASDEEAVNILNSASKKRKAEDADTPPPKRTAIKPKNAATLVRPVRSLRPRTAVRNPDGLNVYDTPSSPEQVPQTAALQKNSPTQVGKRVTGRQNGPSTATSPSKNTRSRTQPKKFVSVEIPRETRTAQKTTADASGFGYPTPARRKAPAPRSSRAEPDPPANSAPANSTPAHSTPANSTSASNQSDEESDSDWPDGEAFNELDSGRHWRVVVEAAKQNRSRDHPEVKQVQDARAVMKHVSHDIQPVLDALDSIPKDGKRIARELHTHVIPDAVQVCILLVNKQPQLSSLIDAILQLCMRLKPRGPLPAAKVIVHRTAQIRESLLKIQEYESEQTRKSRRATHKAASETRKAADETKRAAEQAAVEEARLRDEEARLQELNQAVLREHQRAMRQVSWHLPKAEPEVEKVQGPEMEIESESRSSSPDFPQPPIRKWSPEESIALLHLLKKNQGPDRLAQIQSSLVVLSRAVRKVGMERFRREGMKSIAPSDLADASFDSIDLEDIKERVRYVQAIHQNKLKMAGNVGPACQWLHSEQ